MKKRKFILIADETMVNYESFRDFYSYKDSIVISSYRNTGNAFLNKIEHAHLNRNFPCKWIWNIDEFIKKEIRFEEDTEYYILCFDFAQYIVRRLKEIYFSQYKIKFVLLIMNALSQVPKTQESIKNFHFDYIFTFDQADAKKYGFHFFDSYYSVLSHVKCVQPKSDIYFVGRCLDRLKTIHEIFSDSKKHGVSGKFRIICVPKKEQIYKEEIIYNQAVKYKSVVDELMDSNCILEILRSGQSGATLRYYEAVCYNKKLLTNNKDVVNLPFYNPEYMHIFEKPEDIDWEWVKERTAVDYHYDGRFSPTRLIDRIIEMEEEKERNSLAEKEQNI